MSALAALLLLASPADGAIEAERAFASAAQTEGQWTAFRAFAAPNALMFVPRERNAHDFLEGRDDPISAVMWWPARSFVSCDGTTASNTGSWVRSRQGTVGYFTTVWQLQDDGSWRWLLDHGNRLDVPRPVGEEPVVQQAACPSEPLPAPAESQGSVDEDYGVRHSPDGTLRWTWHVTSNGTRTVTIELFDGNGFETVLMDRIEGSGE